MTTVLLVEDHPLFREGFAAMMAAHRPGWRLRLAGSAAEALSQLTGGLEAGPPDLVIVDIMLPGEDGFAAMRAIGARAPTVPLVAISGREDVAVRRQSRECGAAAFIAKAWPPERILGTLDLVRDGRPVPPCGGADIALAEGLGAVPDLTPRQLEVLVMLAEGCSNKQIERRLGIAARTVRAHLTETFQVLGVDGRLRAVMRARALGLIQ